MANAESVSATLDATRSCTIEITNKTNNYSLINPKVYTVSGYCCDPPQPTISSKETGVCAITKTAGTACGAVGVLTYDLCQIKNQVITERIAILFSVPYNYDFYNNVFGIGAITTDHECNKALYNDMYYGKNCSFTRVNAKESGITHKDERVELRATMSNVGKAIIKVEIHDRLIHEFICKQI